ncbi:hypothetical protein KCP69_24660 [Salmonella enterica subsp. enterica]|nr:hypothetical protein KCP69_24660 [Salmonella enterica subsp. enterica]
MNSIRALTVICAARYLAKPSPPISGFVGNPVRRMGAAPSACRKVW